VCKTANLSKAKSLIATAHQQIFSRASVSEVDKIFDYPTRVRKQANSPDAGAKSPAKAGAKARASQAQGKLVGQNNLRSLMHFDEKEKLLLSDAWTKIPGKRKKSPPRRSYGDVKDRDISFHLRAVTSGAHSSSGESPPGKPSVSDVPLNASPTRSKSPKRPKRRQRKKNTKQQTSVGSLDESSSSPPKASIPASPATAVSDVSADEMDVGELEDVSTASVTSNRTYASATAGTQIPKRRQRKQKKKQQTSVDPLDESSSPPPKASSHASPATAVSEVSKEAMDAIPPPVAEIPPPRYQARIADLMAQVARLQAQLEVAKLQAQVDNLSRTPTGARSPAETNISEPSSVTATTPEVVLDETVVQSPPAVVRSTAEPSVLSATSSVPPASSVDTDADASAVTLPLRTPSGTQAMEHPRPSSDDSPPSSKRFRPTVLIDTKLALLAASTEADADDLVNNAASQVSHLTLENIPRSRSSESGMPL
jgi:hypothetical protein